MLFKLAILGVVGLVGSLANVGADTWLVLGAVGGAWVRLERKIVRLETLIERRHK